MKDIYVLCEEDADWDWWLKLSPQTRGAAVKLFREMDDARKLFPKPRLRIPMRKAFA